MYVSIVNMYIYIYIYILYIYTYLVFESKCKGRLIATMEMNIFKMRAMDNWKGMLDLV